MDVKVGISNRHIHLTKEDFIILFGNDKTLTKRNDLYQEGEFACLETVTIKSNYSFIEKVRIIGPFRNYTQVEISKTDSYFLKIDPPYRDSSFLSDASFITIEGPKGRLENKKCCIMPVRHIHVNSDDDHFVNGEKVSVKVSSEKGGILDNVYIKKGKSYKLELHLDTDDANAFNLKNNDIVQIIK